MQYARFSKYPGYILAPSLKGYFEILIFLNFEGLRLLVTQNHNLSDFLGKKELLTYLLTLKGRQGSQKIAMFFRYFLYICKPISPLIFAIKGKTVPPFECKFNVESKNRVILQHLSDEISRYLTICAAC